MTAPIGALEGIELALDVLDDALDTLDGQFRETLHDVRVRAAAVRDELESIASPEVEDDGS